MPKFPFLSQEWIVETRKLREEFRGRIPRPIHSVKVNQKITGVPFGDGHLESHLDTTAGEPEIDLGHLPDAEATVTCDYETAKRVFVNGDLQAGLEALQLGRIQVDGDMTKLMMMTNTGTDAASIELSRRVREITE